MFTEFIREQEPAGVTVSVGGEIGEVGQRNSTVQELHAFMTAYMTELQDRERMRGATWRASPRSASRPAPRTAASSCRTARSPTSRSTSRPWAQLSEVARDDYGLGGAVQHGASTLPEVAFGRFAEANAIEVHLATAFQNQIFEHAAFPADLKDEIYAYLSANHADERKEGQTDAQFFYSARKRAFGPFKRQLWDLPVETRDRIATTWKRASACSCSAWAWPAAPSSSIASCPASTSPRRCRTPWPRPWPARSSWLAPRAEATLEEVEGE